MLKFALTIMVFIIPILIIVNLIAIIINVANAKDLKDTILTSLCIFGFGIGLSFVITLIVGYVTYIIDKSDILKNNENTITTGRLIIKKDYIIRIKAKRFLFLYSFVIYTKPWKRLSLLTYYFYNKDELINFINENNYFIQYIRKEDLIELGIDEASC
jgi:hypothetical protein